jgi:serine/threonine protein kinase
MSHRTPASAFEADEVLLEKYRVVRVIGSGGYGAVLEAENLRTTRRVAIKVLHGAALARPSTAMKRLHNEARAAARLSHPNSVDVLDLERDADGTLYFVQEFLEGESLYARMQREGCLGWRDACDVMLPVMSALAEAHRKGIVHRDVKPENIFLSRPAPGVMVPKIIDFGIARLAGDRERLTLVDRVVGTPMYMSPEQATGERDLDGQTDVWAVGAVLYELLTGASPFTGSSVSSVLDAIAAGAVTPLRLKRPEVAADVAAVVERALTRDRTRRYATMNDLLQATLACVDARGVGVGVLRTSEAAEPEAPAAPALTTAPPPPASPRRERRRALGGMAFTLLLGFALGATLRLPAQPSASAVALPPRTRIAGPPAAAAAPPVAAPAALAPPVATPAREEQAIDAGAPPSRRRRRAHRHAP